MDVQVKYVLVSCLPVLLDYADSVSFCSLFDGYGDLFDDSVKVGDEFLWNFENGLVMFLRYNQRMPFIEGSYVQESHCLFVFVYKTGKRFFLRYLTECAWAFVQGTHRLSIFVLSFLGFVQCFKLETSGGICR